MNKIGLDNGLAPSGRQAFIWTNAVRIHLRAYAALGTMKYLNEAAWRMYA